MASSPGDPSLSSSASLTSLTGSASCSRGRTSTPTRTNTRGSVVPPASEPCRRSMVSDGGVLSSSFTLPRSPSGDPTPVRSHSRKSSGAMQSLMKDSASSTSVGTTTSNGTTSSINFGSSHSSLKSRRLQKQLRERAPMMQDAYAGVQEGRTLTAAQTLAWMEASGEPIVQALVERIIHRLVTCAPIGATTAAEVEAFLARPDVSCLVHEFALQTRAGWNTHHLPPVSFPTSPLSPGSGSHQPRSPAAGGSTPGPGVPRSKRATAVKFADGKEFLRARSSGMHSISPAASIPSPPSFSIHASARASMSKRTSAAPNEIEALQVQAAMEKAKRMTVEAVGEEEEEVRDWPLPQRLTFWITPPSTSPSAAAPLRFDHTSSMSAEEKTTSDAASATADSRPTSARLSSLAADPQQHFKSSAQNSSSQLLLSRSASSRPTAARPERAPGGTAALVTGDGVVRVDARGESGEGIHIYTGMDVSLMQGETCVVFAHVPRDASGAVTSPDPQSIEHFWSDIICSTGPLSSSPSEIASPAAQTHWLFASMLALTQAFLPEVEKEERREKEEREMVTGEREQVQSKAEDSVSWMDRTGGSATAAAKLLRSSASAASLLSAATSTSTTDVLPPASTSLRELITSTSFTLSSLAHLIHLPSPAPPQFTLPSLRELEDEKVCFAVLSKRENVKVYEAMIVAWCGQMAQALAWAQPFAGNDASSADVNSDRDAAMVLTGGPQAELDHWRRTQLVCTHLCSQFPSHKVRSVLRVLSVYRSRHVKVWSKLQGECVQVSMEADDNVKYLHALNVQCSVLYSGPPQEISQALPHIFSAIQLLQSLAGFYHTTERLTTLLVRTANQVVDRCAEYLDSRMIWTRPQWAVLDALTAALHCCHTFRHLYASTRARLREASFHPTSSSPSSSSLHQWDFSPSAIFGRMEHWERRVEKVKEVRRTMSQMERLDQHDTEVLKLSESRRIEGLDHVLRLWRALKVEVFETGFGKGGVDGSSHHTKYDLLAVGGHADKAFERDYTRFNAKVTELENALIAFMHDAFAESDADGMQVTDWTRRALIKLSQLNQLLAPPSLSPSVPSHLALASRPRLLLALRTKHVGIFGRFSRDLLAVKSEYEARKQEPPLPPNCVAPTVGAIEWLRLLTKKVAEPMRMIVQEKVAEYELEWHPPSSSSTHSASKGSAPSHRRRGSNSSVSSSTSLVAAYATASLTRPEHVRPTGGPVAMKVIKMYNSLITTLYQAEQTLYKSWIESLQQVDELMQRPVLKIVPPEISLDGDPDATLTASSAALALASLTTTSSSSPSLLPYKSLPPRLSAWLDPLLLQCCAEARGMRRLGLKVPKDAEEVLLDGEADLKSHLSTLHSLLVSYTFLTRHLVSPTYAPMMHPRWQRLWNQLHAGLNGEVNWASSRLPAFLTGLQTSLDDLTRTVEKANDILEARIIRAIDKVENTELFHIPPETLSPASFLAHISRQVSLATPQLNSLVHSIELSTYEFVEMVCDKRIYTKEDRRMVREEKINLIGHVHLLQAQAVAGMVEKNLQRLRECFVASGEGAAEGSATSSSSPPRTPLFSIHLSLSRHTLLLTPSLAEIHHCVTRSARMIVASTSGITVPGQVRGREGAAGLDDSSTSSLLLHLSSYHSSIGRNRRLVKLAFQLTGAFEKMKRRVESVRDRWKEGWEWVWKEDKETVLKEFLQDNPSLEDFACELEEFEEYEKELDEIAGRLESSSGYHHEAATLRGQVKIECLTLDSHKLISQLKAELLCWKSAYGKHLLARASRQCSTLSIDLVEHLTFLQQPITTIEDYIACTQRTSELRADESGWEMRLQPIARAHELLRKHGLDLPEAEVKALQATEQQWSELQSDLHTTSHRLIELRPRFHAEYLERVKTWRKGVKGMKERWDSEGEEPFVSELQPTVAAERLEIFQAEYDRSSLEWRSWQHLARFFHGEGQRASTKRRLQCSFLERMSRELMSGRDPARASAEEDSTRSFQPVAHDLLPAGPTAAGALAAE